MPAAPLDQPLTGAYCQLEQLLAARLHSRQLRAPVRISRSQGSGGHRSHARGRGLEFEEVRPYQAGDDVRTIDWRVTARSQAPYTKLFRSERERPLLLLVDQRQPMFFGSQHCFKSVLAAHLAALLAWAGLAQGDRVGGLILGDREERCLRPRRSRRNVLALLSAMADFNRALRADTASSPATNGLIGALTELRRTARPGASVWLISDFAGAGQPEFNRQLQLLARHTTVNAIWVHDPLELALPTAGRLGMTDGRQKLAVDSSDRQFLQRYARLEANQHRQLLQNLRECGVNCLQASTAKAPLSLATQLREGLK